MSSVGTTRRRRRRREGEVLPGDWLGMLPMDDENAGFHDFVAQFDFVDYCLEWLEDGSFDYGNMCMLYLMFHVVA